MVHFQQCEEKRRKRRKKCFPRKQEKREIINSVKILFLITRKEGRRIKFSFKKSKLSKNVPL